MAKRARSKTHHALNRPPFDCIALLLQGGGALGAYQGGVYQALAEAHIHPDWVAGISIGALESSPIMNAVGRLQRSGVSSRMRIALP